MKNILVPVDFSPASTMACRFALELARLSKANVHLLHTFETPVIYSEAQALAAQVDYTLYREEAEREMNECLNRIRKEAPDINLNRIVKQGLPSAQIMASAEELKAELVVMGTTGKGAVERLLVGSNAMRMVKHAPCLLLLVPPDAAFAGFSKIVFATDLSDDNLKHVSGLLPLAKLVNAELLFLNIQTPDGNPAAEAVNLMTEKIRLLVHYPKVSGYFCREREISKGIQYFLDEQKAGFLAMYTRHRGLFGELFKPSLTGRMSLHCRVPLLVIHEKDNKHEE